MKRQVRKVEELKSQLSESRQQFTNDINELKAAQTKVGTEYEALLRWSQQAKQRIRELEEYKQTLQKRDKEQHAYTLNLKKAMEAAHDCISTLKEQVQDEIALVTERDQKERGQKKREKISPQKEIGEERDTEQQAGKGEDEGKDGSEALVKVFVAAIKSSCSDTSNGTKVDIKHTSRDSSPLQRTRSLCLGCYSIKCCCNVYQKMLRGE